MQQLAIVAYYGEKATALANLLTACQGQLARTLGAAFQPYALEQLHATMIGLEQVADAPGDNLNFAHHRQEQRRMDVVSLVNALRHNPDLPLSIRIGGFQERPYRFDSRGQTPYARSFSIQGDKLVLMGWPITPGQPEERLRPDLALDRLRRDAQRFNVLHKYHARPSDVDNDFYLRLGLLHSGVVPATAVQTAAVNLRHYLSIIQPVQLTLTVADLSLVRYTDERLPRDTTTAWSFRDEQGIQTILREFYSDP
jgi:hypothetical protein